MFCVIYEFTVNISQQERFKDLWHQLTLRIRSESNSSGSRLHKVIDDDITWVAYAQWPSRSDYENTPEKVSYQDLQEHFVETCAGIKILYQLECIDNLFL